MVMETVATVNRFRKAFRGKDGWGVEAKLPEALNNEQVPEPRVLYSDQTGRVLAIQKGDELYVELKKSKDEIQRVYLPFPDYDRGRAVNMAQRLNNILSNPLLGMESAQKTMDEFSSSASGNVQIYPAGQ